MENFKQKNVVYKPSVTPTKLSTDNLDEDSQINQSPNFSFLHKDESKERTFIPTKWRERGWKYIRKSDIQDPTKLHPNFYGFTKHTRDIINENKESFDKIEDSHYKATFKHKTPQDRGGHIRIKNETMERELRYPPLIHV